MVVRAKTEYTKELAKKFARFHMSKKKWQIVYYIVLELIMFALACSFIITSENMIELIISVVVFTPLFLLLVPAVILMTPLITVRMSKRLLGSVNTYDFSDNEVVMESAMTFAGGQIRANYNYFESVYETKDCFYMYISKQQALVVNKSDLIAGSVSDLQELFRRNMPADKYIVKTNRSKFIPIFIAVIIAVIVIMVAYSTITLLLNDFKEILFSKSVSMTTLKDNMV